MNPTMKIEGIAELSKQLQGLAFGMRTQIASEVLLQLADDIAVTAKAKVPVDTGALRDSIDTWLVQEEFLTMAFTGTSKALLKASARDSLYHGDTFYGGFIEFGYRRGKRKGGKRVGTKLIIDNDPREQVPARPYLRPAFDEHLPQWLASLPYRLDEAMQRTLNAA